jgi:hypothetical protein
VVASLNAPATLAWNSTAPSERGKAEALVAETINLLPFRDVLRNGTNWLAFHALNSAPNDPDFLLDAELVTEKSGALLAVYLDRPTPGASNNVPWNLGRVADTRFSTTRGFASAPFDLAISSATEGAEIRYTLDGSVPTAEFGQVYTNRIRISQTTVVRAAAFKRNYRPTNVDTHTYVLLNSTIAQPSRPAGFPTTWAGLSPDYAMDTRITQNPAYAPRMADSLKSLPTLSIATDVDNLFGPSRGIYANPERSGLSWERPISMEWIEPDGGRVFQAGAGIRIQGGYFRSRNATHKHSLRLLFKDEYGPGRLRTDLFGVFGAVRDFDTLVLRAGANDGYAWDAARDTEQFLRDEFGRRIHLGMGQVSPHGRFVHVYLNGLYWGIYNLTERPAEDFSVSYFGGKPEDWDAINSGEVKNGSLSDWNTFISRVRTAATLTDYQKLKGLRPDGSPDPTAPAFLDATNYIDYMLLNIWGGNWDWPNKNFWFGRDRTGASGGFKFYLWDFENTMGNNRDRSPLEMVSPRAGITGSWVGEPHDRLRRLEEYRMEFADRVHRHCFNGGVLSTNALIPLYRALANGLESAIVAETARWGDDHHSPPRTSPTGSASATGCSAPISPAGPMSFLASSAPRDFIRKPSLLRSRRLPDPSHHPPPSHCEPSAPRSSTTPPTASTRVCPAAPSVQGPSAWRSAIRAPACHPTSFVPVTSGVTSPMERIPEPRGPSLVSPMPTGRADHPRWVTATVTKRRPCHSWT